MNTLKLALIAGVAAASVVGFASAASAETTVAYNAGVATDYIFRGIEQTGGEPEVFGGIDIANGGLYAGTWVSNTGFAGDSAVEYDLYAGYKMAAGPFSLDLGAIYYGYTDGQSTAFSKGSNYEIKLTGSVPVGPLTVGAAVYWTPDFGQTSKSGTYYEINGAYTLANKATISAAYGQQSFDVAFAGIDSYATWNAGVTYPVTDNLSIDARYIGVDDDGSTLFSGGDRLVGTLKVTF